MADKFEFRVPGSDTLADNLQQAIVSIAAVLGDKSLTTYRTMTLVVQTENPAVARVLREMVRAQSAGVIVPVTEGPELRQARAAIAKASRGSTFPGPKPGEKQLCLGCGKLKHVNDAGLCIWCEKRARKGDE